MSIGAKHAYRFGFLRSQEWKDIRIKKLAECGAECFVCGLVDWSNDAHHVEYPKEWKQTKSRHLVILCRSCHELAHEMMDLYPRVPPIEIVEMIYHDRMGFRKAVKKLRVHRVTGIGLEQFEHRDGLFWVISNLLKKFQVDRRGLTGVKHWPKVRLV